ncbi:MAG: L-threonylcarbamoyladenylate synthase [Chitinophagales bacterium]|jgi:L-threonylcarbamoyladenylate synthase
MFLLRDDINEIASLFKSGKLICFPTDTVWAIGCDATNPVAITQLRALKQLPDQEGLVVLAADTKMVKDYAAPLPPRIETLLELHQRPLTLVYPQNLQFPKNVTAKDGSVAVRVVKEEFCTALLQTLGLPIIATTANLFGSPIPSTFGGISSEILKSVDYVVKYKQDDKTPGSPSPIARLDASQELEFIRE